MPDDRGNIIAYKGETPLLNFSSEVDQVRLDEEIEIRRLSPEVVERLRNRDATSERERFTFLVPDLSKAQFSMLVECRIETEELTADFVFDRVWRAITTLRLFQAGNIGTPSIDLEARRESQDKSVYMTATSSELESRRFGTTYHLVEGRVSPLVDFWRAVGPKISQDRLSKHVDLRLALDRFNYTYSQGLARNRILDLVIGLEALLSRESDEIAFRLSRRVGLLLGATDLERLEVSSLVRTAYKIRNQIVHGGEAKDSYMVEGRPLSAEAISHRIERVLARCAIIVGLSRAEIPRNELAGGVFQIWSPGKPPAGEQR